MQMVVPCKHHHTDINKATTHKAKAMTFKAKATTPKAKTKTKNIRRHNSHLIKAWRCLSC